MKRHKLQFFCVYTVVIVVILQNVANADQNSSQNNLGEPKKCEDGWQGKNCEFCGGKIRLTDDQGFIHDGYGNYSIGVKCSWLIDAREALSQETSNSLKKKHKPKSIRLHIEEFATECSWDHLYIYDGDSVKSPLLAVFSGLMYKNNFSIRRVPEVVATSGAALLHFFSDDAYNMSGFNISYRVNTCPTVDSSIKCSGHGVCLEDGSCTCDRGFMGEACHIPKCPNNCSNPNGSCNHEKHRCSCKPGFAGSDCSRISSLGYWEVVETSKDFIAGSASHASAVYGDTMYIVGGESYQRGKLIYAYDFNGNVWETIHIDNTEPSARYASSSVVYGDKIFVYGGVAEGSGISNELWAFDISARNWENIRVKTDGCNSTAINCRLPLGVAGHTATIVQDAKKVQNLMIVIFGQSSVYGYLNTVQEYNFGTREWRVIQTHGYPVRGGYGHSSAYDELTKKIYVYGGIVSESESQQMLSNKIYSYDPWNHNWTLLTASFSARYLHTANFISSGLMIVFGGNTHNDTSHSFGAKCYSNDLLMYDVLCDTWHQGSMPRDLQADLARYGHSAQVFEHKLWIYGGFDGQMLSDVITFTPGNCKFHEKQESCLSANSMGVKCVWDQREFACRSLEDVSSHLNFSVNDKGEESFIRCTKRGRMEMTQLYIAKEILCSEQHSCKACLSTSSECGYCENTTIRRGSCVLEKCSELVTTKSRMNSPVSFIKSVEKCPNENESLNDPICSQFYNCHACTSIPECSWSVDGGKCFYLGNRTTDETNLCPPSCASLKNCGNCTQEDCIWCQNEERCVDKNAYIASFPYGQCREWTTQNTKCRAPQVGLSQCSYKTCAQCRDDPACGWCDDNSKTGLGKCLDGGDSGPADSIECGINQWYFTHCPSCQCNGHSTCNNGLSTCGECSGNIFGDNCDKCKSGFWGSPIQGGKCQPCECNNKASSCHPDNGKCFCNTKGLAGDNCEKCDGTNHYHGDPKKDSCFYDLTIDYQFTFNLSKKEDKHYTQINFRNSPVKADIDADFTITCSAFAKMNISIRVLNQSQEKSLFSNLNCTTFRQRFSKNEFQFGSENNVTITTFYVYVYDFQPPLWIQIAFSQYPRLNLQQFFVTFSTCFLLLLFMAAILWKIKQKYDMFRRRQRLFVEMEQMASRPFSQVLVELDLKDPHYDVKQTLECSNIPKKRRKNSPSPIALEPCYGNRAAVLSLLVKMPTGGQAYSPSGQSAGLAIASSLVTLGHHRRSSLEFTSNQGKEVNKSNKRKTSQHLDNI